MKKLLHIGLGIMLTLAACQSEQPTGISEGDRSIYLSATLDGEAFSRTPYSQTLPTVEKPLHSSVWASTTTQVYPDGELYGNSSADEYKVAVHSEATFRGNENQLLRDAIYPHDGKSVYFVGLHPHSVNWQTVDPGNNVANCTFSGKEDVMYAPEVFGTYQKLDDDKVDWEKRVVSLHYYHLLTWLRLKIIAEDEEVVKAWGKINRITIASKNHLSIDLTQTAIQKIDSKNVLNESCVTFTGEETTIPFYGKDTDSEYVSSSTIPNIPLGQEATVENIQKYAQEVAYVLCAPVNATYEVDDGTGTDTKVKTAEYVITIDAENRTGVKINVDLKQADDTWFTGSTMGKQFTVLLNFKIGNTIAVQTGLTGISDWQHAGGIGEGHLKE